MAAVVVVSLFAAAAVLFRSERFLVVDAAIVAGAFAVVDCAEPAHQIGASRPSVAAFAGMTKVLHLAAALAACAVLVRVLRSPDGKPNRA